MSKVSTTIYLDLKQRDKLKKLSKETDIPQAVLIRHGINLIIAKMDRRGKGPGRPKKEQANAEEKENE